MNESLFFCSAINYPGIGREINIRETNKLNLPARARAREFGSLAILIYKIENFGARPAASYLFLGFYLAGKRGSSRFSTRFSVTSIRLILAGRARKRAMLNRFKLLRITSARGARRFQRSFWPSPFHSLKIPFTCASHLIDLKSNIHSGYYSARLCESS